VKSRFFMNQALPERRLLLDDENRPPPGAGATHAAVEDRFETGEQYKHFRQAVKRLKAL